MSIIIRKITDPDDPVLEVAAQWICDWWEEEDPNIKLQIKTSYKRSVCADRLPQTYVAYKDGEPVGTFQFAMSDPSIYVRPDLYPWIKNVYVPPEHRNNGYSSEMMEAAVAELKAQGIKHMYLFTHMTGFYEKFGWVHIENFDTYDEGLKEQKLYELIL